MTKTSDLRKIAAYIDEHMRKLGDPERKERSKTYFPTAMEVIGVKTPLFRGIVKDAYKQLKDWKSQSVVELARLLLKNNTLEGRHAAYELISMHKETLNSLDQDLLEELGTGMDNWASTDSFSIFLSGFALREDLIGDKTIVAWSRSEDRWWRRAALVSTVPLNLKSRGGTGDTPRTLKFCKLLVADPDEMVGKALSWALRELAKSDPDSVEEFLETHQDALQARVLREVRNKLRTGVKTPK